MENPAGAKEKQLLLSRLYEECLSHFSTVCDLDYVVSDSIPIPYFGDLEAYLKSPVRIVTAALNPSDREFPLANPRFDVAAALASPVGLASQLEQYFRHEPYSGWFCSFEPVLNGLDASYGGKMANRPYGSTALHLDMCTPVATSPTWSKLSRSQRERLAGKGQDIFESLVDLLQPDLVIASLSWTHLRDWNTDFANGPSWKELHRYTTTKDGRHLRSPLLVQIGQIGTRSGNPATFANASAADKPFGRFSTERKIETGRKLFAYLAGRK